MVDLKDLASLKAIVAEGSFDAGARAMCVTPGAMSQRIKLLEEKVGQVLLLRTQPPSLTAAGEAMLHLAHQVELLHGEAMKAIRGEGSPARDSVIVAVNHDSLATWFLTAIAAFVERRAVRIDLRAHEREQTHRLLRQGLAIAAVTSEVVPVQGCKVTPLGSLRYVAVASSAFAQRWFPPGFGTEAWTAAPLVAFDRADDLALRLMRRYSRKPPLPPTHYVPASIELVQASRLGLGWCMAPLMLVEPLLAAGELVRLGRDAEIDAPLFWQTWNLKSALVQELTDAVTTGARRCLQKPR